MLIINSLELNGFMRFKDKIRVEFKDGIGVIYGNNGSGKTSIFDAVCMALYGKSYRTSGSSENGFLGNGDLVNKLSKKSNIVLTFNSQGKEYKVEKNISRSGKTSTYLYENDQQIAEGKKVHDLISKKIVGMDFTSFKNSLFIAQNEAMSILETTGSERKNILKSLLKLNIYDYLIDTSNELKKEYENMVSKIEGELEILKNNIANENEIEEKIKKLKADIVELKSEKNEEKINQLKKEVEELEKTINDENKKYENLSANIESLRMSNVKLNKEISDLNERLSKINGVSVCPYCLSKITDHKHLEEHYQNEINNRKKEIEENNKTMSEMKKELDVVYNKIDDLNRKIKLKNDEIAKEEMNISNSITEIKTEIKNYENELSKITKYKNEIKTKEDMISKLNEKILSIETLKEAYREIPNIIIRRIIPFIEKEAGEIANYISDGLIEDIKIDTESFKIKPVVNGETEEIQFLSGGERLRVGIALRLAISKMILMTSSYTTSIKSLFVDEGDFGALDENGLNDIASLFIKLKEKFDKIILITHIESLKNNVADYAYNVIKNGSYSSSIVETTNV